MFRIGQKVVCVFKPIRNAKYMERTPDVGGVYTVRAMMDGGIRVHEISNPAHRYIDGTYECYFVVGAFRPAVEKSTDTGMAILKEILERETVRDPVRATS